MPLQTASESSLSRWVRDELAPRDIRAVTTAAGGGGQGQRGQTRKTDTKKVNLGEDADLGEKISKMKAENQVLSKALKGFLDESSLTLARRQGVGLRGEEAEVDVTTISSLAEEKEMGQRERGDQWPDSTYQVHK